MGWEGEEWVDLWEGGMIEGKEGGPRESGGREGQGAGG